MCNKLPKEANGVAPQVEPGQVMTEWQAAWSRENCTCCQHLQFTEQWDRCKDGCVRMRFPMHVCAEWELMLKSVEDVPIMISTPMGGMTHVQHRINIQFFLAWAEKVERLPRRRWRRLVEIVEQMLAEWEKDSGLKGMYSLDKADWATIFEHGVQVGDGSPG